MASLFNEFSAKDLLNTYGIVEEEAEKEIEEEAEEEEQEEISTKKKTVRSKTKVPRKKKTSKYTKSGSVSLIRNLISDHKEIQLSKTKTKSTIISLDEFHPPRFSGAQLIHFTVPSRSRPDQTHRVIIEYTHPTIEIYCDCGESFGMRKRINCYHVQSILNHIFENYMSILMQSFPAKKTETSDVGVKDRTRKRQRTQMDVDDTIPREDESESQSPTNVIDMLSSMVTRMNFRS
jgi:hypothetical protein